MRRKMRNAYAPTTASAATLALAAGAALANSGTQLPLSQYQAGTEQTSPSLVTNGNFEQTGAPNPNPNPTGWTREGTLQVGTPINPPNPPSAVGNFAAQGPLGSSTDPNKFTQIPTLAPNTNYVLSGYLWNFGVASTASQFGDLTVVELVDTKDLLNTKTISIERVATDMGDAANGYFVYDTFNSSQFPNGAVLEVEADFGENVSGSRPNIWAQVDNVAITPAANFTPPQPIGGGSSTWNTNGGGAWTNPANWQGGVPNAAGAVANFGPVITSPATVSLDTIVTVGTIHFNNANKYTIQGDATLRLDATTGPAGINVVNGSHEIDTFVDFVDDTVVNVQQAGSTLRLTRGNAPSPGSALTKTGAGALETRFVRTRALTVSDGTFRVLPNGTRSSSSAATALAVDDAAARLDVTNNAFTLDYTGASPLPDVKADIARAYSGGAWTGTGITSSLANNSTHGVGFAEASSLSSIPEIFEPADATSVLFRYTRYGDANLDGQVNLADFNRLASNFGATAANWDQGDFNYDGNVNLADFNRLASNFGQAAAGPTVTPEDWAALASAVPEPSAVMLGAFGAVALLVRRRRSTVN